MHWRSLGIVAALAGGLALGVVVGPSLRGSIANAQTQPPTPTPAPTQPATVRSTLQNLFLDRLAAALNIQRSTLDSAITSAGTSAVDAALQQGTLTQAQADALKARIQAGDIGVLWSGPKARYGGPRLEGIKQAMLAAAAQALGITPDELVTQLRSGQTLAQLAQAHNTTEQAVIDAALAAAKTQLDQAVAAGTLTQTQADALYAKLQQAGARLFVAPGRGHRGGGWWRAPASPQSPTTTPST
jgi:hypothetical protein